MIVELLTSIYVALADISGKALNAISTYKLTVEEEKRLLELSSEEEKELLAVAYLEAGNQGVEGIALVMCVVLNRVEDVRFPSTVHDVLHAPRQFGTVRYADSVVPNDDTYQAWELVKSGWDESEGALYFSSNGRALGTFVMTYKGHNFYK